MHLILNHTPYEYVSILREIHDYMICMFGKTFKKGKCITQYSNNLMHYTY